MWLTRRSDEDEPAETCAELGMLAHEAVNRIYPDAEEVIRALADIAKLADSLGARGDVPYEPWITYRDTIIVTGHEAARQLRTAADSLREICDALRH
jgi:hypothetical protein